MPSSLGTNGQSPPLIGVSEGSNLVFEWAALIPLVVYLATSSHSHRLVGKLSLGGVICVGLLPKIGILGSLADLLQQGPDFLDRASSVSELRRTVWDVKWGSVFTCANGAASFIVSSYVLQDASTVRIYNDTAPTAATPGSEPKSPGSKGKIAFRRYQTLHVLRCSRTEGREASTTLLHGSKKLHLIVEVLVLFSLLAITTLLCLFGLFGTAAALMIAFAFRICRQMFQIERPAGYLENNEPDSESACMLVSIHENASTWHLYVGSRSVIDSLLNKSMIESIHGPVGTTGTIALAYSLRLLSLLQLLAMTYVAAQKGWDGVGLLCLILVAWMSDFVFFSENRIAKAWLVRKGISIDSKTYQFSGRTAMLGAIQLLAESNVTSWMDGILAPSDRRTVWLAKLRESVPEHAHVLEQTLTPGDKGWVRMMTELSRQAIDIMKQPDPATC